MGIKPGSKGIKGAGICPKFTIKFWFLVKMCGYRARPSKSEGGMRKATPKSRPFNVKETMCGSTVRSYIVKNISNSSFFY